MAVSPSFFTVVTRPKRQDRLMEGGREIAMEGCCRTGVLKHFEQPQKLTLLSPP